MSKQMKILSGAVGVLVLVAVVLTMFGKPPNLPLGPLQGMLASDEAVVDASDVTTDPLAGGLPAGDCGAGLPGATDPATGLPATTDPATGAVDPAAGGAATPGTGATDPTTGAPIAAPGDGWNGDSRVSATGVGSDASRVADERIVAAEAVDPVTGLPTDPAAGVADPAATGAVDPVTGLPTTDPAAPDGAIDPATAGTDIAGAGAGVDCEPDPLGGGVTDPANGAATDPTTGEATDPAAGSTPNAGAPATGTGAAPASTTDGTNTGNSPEALRAAKDATGVMQKAKINVSTTATLVPSAGGVAKAGALRRYRASVTGAVLVMKLDDAAMQQWTGAGKKVQADLVKSFITRLGKTYAKASRSVTVVDTAGNVLAIGDAGVRARVAVKLF